jgi:surfactin synthase thioesterase subunit
VAARYTTGLSSVATLPGGHFFVEDRADAFLRRLSADLETYDLLGEKRALPA